MYPIGSLDFHGLIGIFLSCEYARNWLTVDQSIIGIARRSLSVVGTAAGWRIPCDIRHIREWAYNERTTICDSTEPVNVSQFRPTLPAICLSLRHRVHGI